MSISGTTATRNPQVAPERAAYRRLVRLLAPPPEAGFSGALAVPGEPGGVVRITAGRVTAVASGGAPDAATILVRSGRIGAGEWAAVCQAGDASGCVGGLLVDRALIGARELHLVCRAAALDAAFAIAMGDPADGGVDGPADALDDAEARRLAVAEGLDRDWLLGETERRLRAVEAQPRRVAPFADRLVRAEVVPYGAGPADPRREILAHVDGRSTARDIAFRVGLSLYAVTVGLCRLLADGYVARTSDAAAEPLPRRRRGASGINAVLAPPRAGARIPVLPERFLRDRLGLNETQIEQIRKSAVRVGS
ncbi:hypothetical protein [Yinghuangia seranimata]|uniref:hypothetical protein n=1 Tax=Yinghuangia seranimata TaxID=408067 RepID=UPI00248B8708|nr:hypothetical protein [Yinghuangia seranimata]MDI2129732.1 hypothetical protein [Yinghuangia seranimata]